MVLWLATPLTSANFIGESVRDVVPFGTMATKPVKSVSRVVYREPIYCPLKYRDYYDSYMIHSTGINQQLFHFCPGF